MGAPGFWHRPRLSRTYGFRWPYRAVGAALVLCAMLLVSPLVVLLGAAVVWPVAFGLGLLGMEAGATLAAGYTQFVAWCFAPPQLPTWLPRMVVLVFGLVAGVLASGAAYAAYLSPRRYEGSPLWRMLGAPVAVGGFVKIATQGLSELLGGGSNSAAGARDLSQRYVELLGASVGQPGHRDLLLAIHDLDARRDLVFGLLAGEAGRRQFPGTTGPSARRAEAFDLGTGAKSVLIEVLAGALTPPGTSEPVMLHLPPDSIWRGETHRITDRPAALGRLLEEAAAAGMEQVIVVTATPPAKGPNELTPARVDGRGRLGEWIAAEETAAVRDGLRLADKHFHAVFVVRPDHNPIGPLDMDGADDPQADRRCALADMLSRGYDDAHRLFIEPALGAAGERVGESGW